MTDMIDSKSDLDSSISELESLGLETPQLNELNDFVLVSETRKTFHLQLKNIFSFSGLFV